MTRSVKIAEMTMANVTGYYMRHPKAPARYPRMTTWKKHRTWASVKDGVLPDRLYAPFQILAHDKLILHSRIDEELADAIPIQQRCLQGRVFNEQIVVRVPRAEIRVLIDLAVFRLPELT